MIEVRQDRYSLTIYDESELKEAADLLGKLSTSCGQASIFQSLEWAAFMKWLLGDHRGFAFVLRKGDEVAMVSYAYSYPLRKNLSWLYMPRGPVFLDPSKAKTNIETWYAMLPRDFLKQFVWLRFDPLVADLEKSTIYRPAHASFHPKSTLLLDLVPTEEEILAQMKQKGRYNIRLATKKGVTVELYDKSYSGTLDPVQEFYTLALETTKRDGFSAHSYEYYKQFVTLLAEKAFILLAHYEGRVIAAGIFTMHDTTCTYYYGASSDKDRQVMAPYLIQWEAIRYAKSRGATTYDFLGINDDGKQATGAKLDGVTDFKLKFGGTVATYAGTFEIVVRPFWYLLVRIAKLLRSFH